MVGMMIGDAMKPILTSQAELRERIIGIDSNGTGRTPGTLQRQDAKLQQLDDGQLHIIKQLTSFQNALDAITISTSTWSKARFYKNLPIWLGVLAAVVASVIGYLGYRAHASHEITQGPHAQVETIPADASN